MENLRRKVKVVAFSAGVVSLVSVGLLGQTLELFYLLPAVLFGVVSFIFARAISWPSDKLEKAFGSKDSKSKGFMNESNYQAFHGYNSDKR
ncbi:hypothetical protein [Vibrio mediterranei]|uniref:Uncharacterized protein n=1 Tax=Vibrio mediterranei TaxID=689 RepID=A0ABX5D6K6_9VIBR|nr:hypothetical protein [Vibrio mediterranei]PRQ65115.1 hypothetical protein COR51_23630 [Vibrio mediterranei]